MHGTATVTDIFAKQATGKGNITSDGGATVTERGFCWSTSANPTTADNKIISSGTIGEYSEEIIGLLADTTYHMRTYAINSEGTSYSDDVVFKTHKEFIPLINSGG